MGLIEKLKGELVDLIEWVDDSRSTLAWQEIHSKDTRFYSLTYKHLLLPVWLLTVIFAGRPFQVFINGVTGEVQGQRPYSKVKIAVAVAVAAVLVAVVVALSRGS